MLNSAIKNKQTQYLPDVQTIKALKSFDNVVVVRPWCYHTECPSCPGTVTVRTNSATYFLLSVYAVTKRYLLVAARNQLQPRRHAASCSYTVLS